MIEICTNMHCPLKLQCAYFQAAVNFKGSKFTDIKECHGSKFIQFKEE